MAILLGGRTCEFLVNEESISWRFAKHWAEIRMGQLPDQTAHPSSVCANAPKQAWKELRKIPSWIETVPDMDKSNYHSFVQLGSKCNQAHLDSDAIFLAAKSWPVPMEFSVPGHSLQRQGWANVKLMLYRKLNTPIAGQVRCWWRNWEIERERERVRGRATQTHDHPTFLNAFNTKGHFETAQKFRP